MEQNEKIAYDILNSPLKKIILEQLMISPKTATHIKKKYIERSLSRPSISRALGELKKSGLIKCINQWHHRSRFYSLTDDGKKIFEKIKEIEK